jgi:shikimate 5-dehydrogenase
VTATINGATRLYAIIGDPIAQVRSPQLYTGLFASAGMNAVAGRDLLAGQAEALMSFLSRA